MGEGLETEVEQGARLELEQLVTRVALDARVGPAKQKARVELAEQEVRVELKILTAGQTGQKIPTAKQRTTTAVH